MRRIRVHVAAAVLLIIASGLLWTIAPAGLRLPGWLTVAAFATVAVCAFSLSSDRAGRPALPTASEINPFDDLDGREAERNFLGKTLEKAEALFRENSLRYQEDLMWMGPRAFCFYVEAAARYIRSEAATGDSDIINCFASLLEFRLEHDAHEWRAAAPLLADSCRYVLEHYDRFDVTPEDYGDLRPGYRELEQALRDLP